MKIEIRGASNIGRVRKNNEDSILFDESLGLGIVCDGIGGREGGEVASQLAVEKMKEQIQKWNASQSNPAHCLVSAIEAINEQIIARGTQNSQLEGMGTTMECALFHNETLYLAHIGDSRTYLFYDGQIWPLTIDHNVRTLVQYGDIPVEMEKFAGGDALVKALGVSADVDPDIYTLKVKRKQIFISASDGLFDMVSDQEIAEIVSKHFNSTETILRELVDLALHNGGIDNISVVLMRVL